MKSKNIMLILILLLVVSMVACSKGGPGEIGQKNSNKLTRESIKERGRLVVGTNADYPPFEFHRIVDGRDEIVGLDINISRYIAESLGVDLEIRDMKFNNLLGGVSTGMVDMAVAGMNPEPARLEQVDFSDIYYRVNLAILVNDDDTRAYKTIDDLSGCKIGVQMGTTQEDIARKIQGAEVISLKTNSDAIMNLKTKKVDCALLETIVGESFSQTNEDISLVDGLEIETDSGGSAIATRKGSEEFVGFLNDQILEMEEKGLIDKWMEESGDISKKDL